MAARLTIDDWRWSGVPFYVRTGKRLPKRATEIAIQYREVPHHLFRDEGVEPDANLLAIRIQPDEGIMLRFGAKVPGLGLDVRSVTMDFTYGSAFNVDSPDAYETLILDALQGDASLFTRADEVEEAWGIVDPDHQRLGGRTRRPTSRTTTPARGDPRRPRSCWPATAGAGAGSRDPSAWPRRHQPASASRACAGRRARSSIAGIETELARAWSSQDPGPHEPGDMGRHMAARTNVMNLVVVARRPELAERCAATMHWLTGRHPSRTIVIQSADPDGPSWLDARIEAHCVEPRADAPETCAETIYVTCGGEAGRHLSAVATPLIIHDLPVTVWWPGEPPLASATTRDLLDAADRLVVDGSTWSGDGLGRLREMAELQDSTSLAISDFALMRQSRWREAIASIFDDPDFLPYLRSLRRIAVTYSTHDETGAPGLDQPGQADLSRRLAGIATRPVGGASADTGRRRPEGGGEHASGQGRAASRRWVAVSWPPCRTDGPTSGSWSGPVLSTTPPGTTLRVELLAERRGRELRADVTAEAEIVHVRVWQDGVEALDRHFRAPRRNDTDLLAEAIEANRGDPIAVRGAPVGGRADRRRRRATWTRREWRARVTEPEITVVADRDAGAALAADHIARVLAEAVAARGRADWATTGGSTPVWIYRHLIEPRLATTVPWDVVHVWWGDDRYVQRDHPLLERQGLRRHHARHRVDRGGHRRRADPGGPDPGGERPPVPDRRGDRLGSWRGLVRGRDWPPSSAARPWT